MSNDPNKIQVDWTKVNSTKQSETCCHLCGKVIVHDGVEPLPLQCGIGKNTIHYCSEHADAGNEIFEKFRNMERKFQRSGEYYDEMELLNKIENQYKSYYGDWYIKFRNINNYGKEVINVPILKDNKPIGFISDVDGIYITGRIWSRYIPIIEEICADDKRSMSFEIMY